MKSPETYITIKRGITFSVVLLLIIIVAGVFNLFPSQVILLLQVITLIIGLILLASMAKPAVIRVEDEISDEDEITDHDDINIEQEALAYLTDEADFKTIADQIPFMVWRSDAVGKCIYVNKKWISFTGLSYEDSLGFGFAKSMAVPENEERRHEWREAIKNHRPYEFKFQLKNAEGELRWVLTQANAYHRGVTFQGYIGSIIDITEQENSTIAVQELSDRKDEFLSMASHELKTPLTSIKALFQLIERNMEKDHKAFHFLQRINNNVLRLETLITNLLDVSKINAGKLSYDVAEFSFSEMLFEAVAGMQNIAAHHQLILHNSEPVNFTGDKFRLEQVIYNFLSNAIKYSPEGKEIIVNSEVINGSIIVSVQDFGIGIEKNNMARIFNRYYRVDNSLMKFEGLGLGLFISSEIIKRHNGSFWIESELGKGATFYFILPLTNRKIHSVVETDEFSYYWDETISMQINEENNWLMANWTGYQNFKSVKEGSLVILDLVKKNKCTKVLNDNSRVMGNWSEAADWSAEEWLPAMSAAGVSYFAWIYSPSIFSQLAAEKSGDIVCGITIQFFNNKADAVKWLDSV